MLVPCTVESVRVVRPALDPNEALGFGCHRLGLTTQGLEQDRW